MADQRIRVYVSWIEHDEELLRPLTRRLDALEDELGLEIHYSRHPVGPGLDDEALDVADIVLLMVSPQYLGARSARRDIDRAYARQQQPAKVFAVMVRASDVSGMPTFDVLPSNGRTLVDSPDEGGYDEVTGFLRSYIEARWRDRQPEAAAAPKISPSTREAVRPLADDVVASSIVKRLLEIHPEYGDKKGKDVQLTATASERPVAEWLQRVRDLYRLEAVPELHGRHVIRGLALLEPDLRKQLLRHGFLPALEDELRPPLVDSLSREGERKWAAGKVRTLPDREPEQDQLERKHFAKGLADMMVEQRMDPERQMRPESFLVHLHGPWGAGKTSLLGFLRDDLREREPRWVVVEFNAWQHERLGAPWWSLMTAVHREGLRAPFGAGHAKGRGRWREIWRAVRLLWFDVVWRVQLGWVAYLLLPALLGLLYYAWKQGFFDAPETAQGLAKAGDVAKPVAAIVGLVATLLGAARGLGRSLSVGSARGAETFMKTSRDPMRTLRKRYQKLVSTIGRPVTVFIDDMDRCQSSYVVEVLQGVQTLLVEAPVTYVVAADRRWLYDSYATAYSDFQSVAREPGRPLGHLFLEKTFQLSASLPALPDDVVATYWGMLTADGNGAVAVDAEAIARERERLAGAGLEGLIAEPTGDTPADRRAERAARSDQVGSAAVREEIENRLQPFSRLLEPNPRAMKRLINAYQIELRRLLAEGRRIGRASVTPEEIALWTILSLRWPLLADEVALHPELVEGKADDKVPEALRELWASDAVRAVIEGDGVPALLTERSVRAMVGRASRREVHESPPADGNGAGAVPSVA